MNHANSILEYFEYFCQISSKSIVTNLSYIVSKFARFFLRHSVLCDQISPALSCMTNARYAVLLQILFSALVSLIMNETIVCYLLFVCTNSAVYCISEIMQSRFIHGSADHLRQQTTKLIL